MRELLVILLAFVTSAIVAALVFIAMEISVGWFGIAVIIGSSMFAGLLVLLRESPYQDFVKVGMVLLISGIMWARMEVLYPIFVCACISSIIGITVNQVNRATAK